MPETSANIRISAVGGDEAAAALGQASAGMANLSNQSAQLQEQFSHRFSHIGLQLFVGDALRASGVGAETRQVIGTLNMAVMAAASAFGEAAMPILLVTTALTAVIGIVEKVRDHHKELADSLAKSSAEMDKEAQNLNESITKLETYRGLVGTLPAGLEAVLNAKMRLRDFEDQQEMKTLQLQIEALGKEIAAEREHSTELAKQAVFQENLNAKKLAAIILNQGLTTGVTALIEHFKNFNKATDDNTSAILKNSVALAEARAKLADLKNGQHETIDELIKDKQKEQEEYIKSVNAEADADTARFQHWAELRAKELKQHEEMYHQFAEHAKTAINAINQEQSMAFAKMVVEGQSFAEATAHIWRDLAEQVIAQIEAMMVKMALLYAFTGGGMQTGGFIGKMLGFASGGSFVASQATPIIVGEGGQPELVTVTPFSQMGMSATGSGSGAGNGTTISIGTIQTIVQEASDADAIADQVGMKIAQRIRGQGEINFTRSF